MRLNLIVFSLFAAACTAHVRPHPSLSIAGEPIAMKAALVIPPTLTERTDQCGALDNVGGSFVFETGQSVPQALEEAARKVFSSVTVVDNARKASGVDVILTPSSASLKHATNKTNDYTMRFELHAVAKKQDSGEEVLDERYSEDVTGRAGSTESAVSKPAEDAMAAALSKLAADLHAKLGPVPAVASAGGPDFSTLPAAPPADGPPPAPPLTSAAPLSSGGLGLTAQLPPPSGGAGSGFLMGSGLVLFAAGYAASPALLFFSGAPGDHTYSLIPLAGPMLEYFTNPFQHNDNGSLVLAIAASAGQVVGLTMALIGLGTMGGKSSTSNARAQSVISGQGWAVVPTVSPHGGVGVALVTR
jgi:hypothetical protein